MRTWVLVVVAAASLFMAGHVNGQTCTATLFNDVYASMYPAPMGELFCGWIEWFSALGITSGCQAEDPATPGIQARYCPNDYVTRAQMAVFVSRAMRGGHDNSVTHDSDTVGGGGSNAAGGQFSTVGGGDGNTASGYGSTVGGGLGNAAGGSPSTVGGGSSNIASKLDATVSGGYANHADGSSSTVAGGVLNRANGGSSTVGGGNGNTAGGDFSTVAGGVGNASSGDYSTVAGGHDNTAGGAHSFAAGRRANANFTGCFVWGDSTDADVNCSGPNRLVARASGGVFLYTNSALTSGVGVSAGGGAWNNISDRDAKENFAYVDSKEILDRLAAIPIRTWNWKTQNPMMRHIGPVAQDFHAAFRVGEDDRHISTVDADGVALAAIQGLYQVVREQESNVKEKQERIAQQESRIRQLEAALGEIMKRLADLEMPTRSIAQE